MLKGCRQSDVRDREELCVCVCVDVVVKGLNLLTHQQMINNNVIVCLACEKRVEAKWNEWHTDHYSKTSLTHTTVQTLPVQQSLIPNSLFKLFLSFYRYKIIDYF